MQLEYLSIPGVDSLQKTAQITDKLVDSYRTIFGDPDLWAEDYSQQDVQEKLQSELSGKSCLRVCLDKENKDALAGFCWAQALNAQQIETSIQTIKYFKSHGTPSLNDDLTRLLANEEVLYLHELAVARAYRGRLPLNRLLSPMLSDLSARTGIRKTLFWTIPETRVSALARRGAYKLALVKDGLHFYISE